LRTDGVDLVIRSKNPPDAIALDDSIRAVIQDKRGWTMGGLQIIESTLYRPLSLVGSNDQSFDWSAGYLFQRQVV
jgi:hypothetical protein